MSNLAKVFSFLLLSFEMFAQEPNLCGVRRCSPSDHQCLSKLVLKEDGSPTRNAWLKQEMRWIMPDEEVAAFKKLQNDEERDLFADFFWLRHDPTPETITNEFKEEHYRRMMYANEHFGARVPGWKTERGRIYIMYGPPDNIAKGVRTVLNEQGGNIAHATEAWHYEKFSDGRPGNLEFLDLCDCGDYHYVMATQTKDSSHTDWKDIEPLSKGQQEQSQPPRHIVAGVKWPQTRFKDLEEIVDHRVSLNMLPFTVATASFRITDWTDWVPITIQYNAKDLTWKADGNVQRGTLRIFGRFTTLTQRIVEPFEDEIQLAETDSNYRDKTYIYTKYVTLPPGHYRLDLVVRDMNGDRLGTRSQRVRLSELYEQSISSLVLSKSGGDPVFEAVPNIEQFAPADAIHLYAEVYGLSIDATSKRSDASVDYEVFDVTNPKSKPREVLHLNDTTAELKQTGEMLRIQKEFSLGTWQKGKYELVIRVKDNINQHEMCTERPFTVN